MDDYPVIGIKETIEVLESGTVRALSDVHNIEAALELISKSESKIEEYKEIKKKRSLIIDQEIENLDSRITFLKSVIVATLKGAKKKNISFPGLGKASTRIKKGKWVIKDEAELIKVLQAEGEYTTCVETSEVIKKTEVNKLLDSWNSIKKVPSCVTKEEDVDAVTISFEKTNDDEVVPVISKAKAIVAAVPSISAEPAASDINFDALDLAS